MYYRPDVAVMVDWVLQINYQSIFACGSEKMVISTPMFGRRMLFGLVKHV